MKQAPITIKPKSTAFKASGFRTGPVQPAPQPSPIVQHYRNIGNQVVLRLAESGPPMEKLGLNTIFRQEEEHDIYHGWIWNDFNATWGDFTLDRDPYPWEDITPSYLKSEPLPNTSFQLPSSQDRDIGRELNGLFNIEELSTEQVNYAHRRINELEDIQIRDYFYKILQIKVLSRFFRFSSRGEAEVWMSEVNFIFPDSILTPDIIQEARQMIEEIQDEQLRGDFYEALQERVRYANQRNNRAELNGEPVESEGGSMCNLTSLAMALQFLGIPNPGPMEQYEDSLEIIRQENNYESRTWIGWEQVANHLGADVEFLLGRGANRVLNQEWYEDHVRSRLRGGSAVIMSIRGHIVRLQSVTDSGLIIDDPYGSRNLLSRSWRTKNRSEWNSRGEGVTETEGENNLWTWAEVTSYPMWWIAAIKRKE